MDLLEVLIAGLSYFKCMDKDIEKKYKETFNALISELNVAGYEPGSKVERLLGELEELLDPTDDDDEEDDEEDNDGGFDWEED